MADNADTMRQFQEIDTDDDGFITADELKSYLMQNPKVSSANADQTFRFADENDDNQISYEEFAKFIK